MELFPERRRSLDREERERGERHESWPSLSPLSLIFVFSWSKFYPTGTPLTLIDATGQEAAYILYNTYGGVLTSSLPPELAEALVGQSTPADPDTGLI